MRSPRVLVAAVVAGVLSVAGPVSAANVSVTLQVGVGHPPASADLHVCSLTVPADADGIVVLEAAVDDGCISSYDYSEDPSFGRFVTCIDGVCGAPPEALGITYWRMTENGRITDYGVDDFEADAGDVLGFSYTTWATCLTPIGC